MMTAPPMPDVFDAHLNRIKKAQIKWARDALGGMRLDGKRLHLVTHRSLWRIDDDKHGPMVRRRRLEMTRTSL